MDQDKLYLCFEFMKMDLKEYLETLKSTDWKIKKTLTKSKKREFHDLF